MRTKYMLIAAATIAAQMLTQLPIASAAPALSRSDWDKTITVRRDGQKVSLHSIFTELGNANFDFERFRATKLADETLENYRGQLLYYDNQMAPAFLEYYRTLGRGIVKEMHEGADPARQWVSYIPLSAQSHPRRRYPVIFVLLGGDHFGYAQYSATSAKEEFITILVSNMRPSNVIRVRELVAQTLPVDKSRMYIAGFSGGSWNAEGLMLVHPELFAGFIMGGHDPRFGPRDPENPVAHPDNSDIMVPSDVSFATLEKYHIPLVNIAGTNESGETIPWNRTSTTRDPPDTVKTPAVHAESVNLWLHANGIPKTLTEASLLATVQSKNVVERRLGAPFDHTETRKHGGVDFFFGDFYNDKGWPMMRVIGIDNVPHQPAAHFAQEAVDFIFQFRRDPETKQISFVPNHR